MTQAWSDCGNLLAVPAISDSVVLTNVVSAFDGDWRLTGNSGELWNTNRFPNIVSYQYCYRGCTNLADYASIPAAWK